MNNRRRLIVALGTSGLVAPFRSFAQQQIKVWRVGFLSSRHVDFLDTDNYYGPFRQGMSALGYTEGRNLVIDWRFTDGKSERLPELAGELINLKVNVIVAAGSSATSAAQRATNSIPIVMATIPDPVGSGFVKTLAHPGGNITGLSNLGSELGAKHFEMLLSMVPKLSRLAVLVNPTNPSPAAFLKQIQVAALRTGVTILPLNAATPLEIENAFSETPRRKYGAVIVAPDTFFIQQRRQIALVASNQRNLNW